MQEVDLKKMVLEKEWVAHEPTMLMTLKRTEEKMVREYKHGMIPDYFLEARLELLGTLAFEMFRGSEKVRDAKDAGWLLKDITKVLSDLHRGKI